MDHIGQIPSQAGLTTYSEQSKAKRLNSLEAGATAAKAILSRYPEYAKAPREYLAGMSELLAEYDPFTLKTLTDKHIGISAKCKFLPTPADVVEYVEALEVKRASMRDLRKGRVPEPIMPKPKFKPFPKLWEAFADEQELVDGKTFEILCEASRSLAMFGKESARDVLARRVGT